MEWDLWNERIEQIPAASVDQAGPLPVFLEREWRVLEWQNFLKNPLLPTLRAIEPPACARARVVFWARWPLALIALLAVLTRGARTERRRQHSPPRASLSDREPSSSAASQALR